MSPVPAIRVTRCNEVQVRETGDYVLYWMTAFRRTRWNFSLQHAVEWANRLAKPLLVFEALRVGYPWACDRFHRFVIDGMADNAESLEKHGVSYYPYLEDSPDSDKGLLAALAEKACLVVTDDFPAFFLPRMITAASRNIPVCMEKVDSNGLLPIKAVDRVYAAAKFFRLLLQKELPLHLSQMPEAESLKRLQHKAPAPLSKEVLNRWPAASPDILCGDPERLARFPLDHGVGPVEEPGGSSKAGRRMKIFLEKKLPLYEENRNHPDEDGTSGLSPYLHFGHISVHEIFFHLAAKEEWDPDRLPRKASGGRSGWWHMSEAAEAFLDELVTWRELGFNICAQRQDYDQYLSLPDWARQTLKEHEGDRRRYVYRLEEFEQAQTHDPLWNAAQGQLLQEGTIHNYLRMVWGKKILEWTSSPQEALGLMIELNNKYAIDGRDPNSYTGIMWVLGRYDRPWGPERPVFGKIRYMSSDNTLRKVRAAEYMEKYKPL
ncbi:MAG: deoxyribodipyrimidine photolyase [Deltaproteobacteria bacterium]